MGLGRLQGEKLGGEKIFRWEKILERVFVGTPKKN